MIESFEEKFEKLLVETRFLGIRYTTINNMVNSHVSFFGDKHDRCKRLQTEKRLMEREVKSQLNKIEEFKASIKDNPTARHLIEKNEDKLTALFGAVTDIRAKRKTGNAGYALNTLKEAIGSKIKC